MFSKFLLYGTYATIGTGSATFIASNLFEKEFNTFGIVRFGRAALYTTSIAFDYKLNLFNLEHDTVEYEETLSKLHLRSANKLKELFCKNAGAFIKVGQHMGCLDHLLPEEYVNTMKTLHDNAPRSPVSELFETIETDLKCNIKDIFKHIDENPIGSASLAQCHKAILHDGTVVAVKIQHPTVKKNSYVDIKTMTFLVKCLALIFPRFKFVWLAEETEKNLPIELDFINEGKNIEKLAKLMEKFEFVKIPKVYWEYSSDRVLTMEFCEGNKADDLEKMKQNKINVNKVSERLGIIFSEMIFKNGFVHCDPHPGNILINPVKKKSKKDKENFEIVLLDHGLYQNLSLDFRINYATLWMALIENDMPKMIHITKEKFKVNEYGVFLCIISGRSWESVNKGIVKTKYSAQEANDIKTETPKYLREVSDVLNQVPREMLLLLKTNDLLRGIETSLKTRNSSSSFFHLTKYCVKLIYSQERALKQIDTNQIMNNKKINLIELFQFYTKSYLTEHFTLFKIYFYELFLYLFNI